MYYFIDCQNIDDIKARYKQLAKEHHPDHGGDTETMQQINAAYAEACTKAFRGQNMSQEDADEQARLSEEYRAVIEQIAGLPNITIELVGDWIWVTGFTYPVRKTLKAAGLYFASKKQAWYYRAEEHATKGGKKTLDEIREKYGSETLYTRQQQREIR